MESQLYLLEQNCLFNALLLCTTQLRIIWKINIWNIFVISSRMIVHYLSFITNRHSIVVSEMKSSQSQNMREFPKLSLFCCKSSTAWNPIHSAEHSSWECHRIIESLNCDKIPAWFTTDKLQWEGILVQLAEFDKRLFHIHMHTKLAIMALMPTSYSHIVAVFLIILS